MLGDKECPNCEQISLVEKGCHEWICLNCNRVYSEEFLDEGVEFYDQESNML